MFILYYRSDFLTDFRPQTKSILPQKTRAENPLRGGVPVGRGGYSATTQIARSLGAKMSKYPETDYRSMGEPSAASNTNPKSAIVSQS